MATMAEPMSVVAAARRLGITTEAAYDLVFRRQLRSVAAPSGRRLVPDEAVEEWLSQHPAKI